MIGCILTAVCLSFCMASCSEDDGDGDGSGSSVGTNSAKLGNKTFKVPYGFWHLGIEESGVDYEENVVHTEFYSYNVLSDKFPGKLSCVYIDFDVPAGQNEITSTVLKDGDYHIYVVYDATMSSPGGLQAETDHETSQPDLKIVRNGSKYNISVEGAKLIDSDGNQSYDFSFNFSGQLTHRQIAD